MSKQKSTSVGPFVTEGEQEPSTSAEPEDEEKGREEVFTVEAILAKRKAINGGWEYKIRWKGYEPADDTWEPSYNIHCPEMVREFEEKLASKTGGKKKAKKRKTAHKSVEGEIKRELKDHYHIEEEGVALRTIVGIEQHATAGMWALCAYEGGENAPTPEFVPTSVLRKYESEKLIAHYEDHLELEGVPPEIELKDHYRVQDDGVEVSSILGVDEHPTAGWMAYLLYEGGVSPAAEFVPTSVLREHEPDLLIDFYEMRIQFYTEE